MSIQKRLKEVRGYLEINSQTKFAERLGVSRNIIADAERAKTKGLSSEVALKIEETFHINGWWLLTGQGTMLGATNTEGYSIDVLDLKTSAGSGVMPYEAQVIDKYILDKSFFKTAPQANKLKIIQVEGDSMEPTILDGAYIIIDETKTEFIDGIYACLIDDNIFIKRLQFDLDGSIKIISDNQKYEPKFYNPKNTQIFFKILGRKILTIQR